MVVVVVVWRRKKAGTVKRVMKKSVVHRLRLDEEVDFLDLLLKAIASGDSEVMDIEKD